VGQSGRSSGRQSGRPSEDAPSFEAATAESRGTHSRVAPSSKSRSLSSVSRVLRMAELALNT
jgi:hypothetical protein